MAKSRRVPAPQTPPTAATPSAAPPTAPSDPAHEPAAISSAADGSDGDDDGDEAIDLAVERARHELIYRLEARAKTSHGADVDRDLMREAATLIRLLVGVGDGELLYPEPPAYAPVEPAPPIGHSLPDVSDGDSER